MSGPAAGGARPEPLTARTTVSVVVPVLDDADHLRACLALLARQTRRPDEVVVVDNGSTDDSAAVARAAGARVIHEPVRGIPSAAAAGYDAARGDLILRCDADSRVPEDWVERIVARFAAQPEMLGLTGPGVFYDQPGLLSRVRSDAYTAAYRWVGGAAVAGTPLWGSNCALRAEAWRDVRDRVHRHRADVHDDFDLSFQLLLHAPGCTRFDAGLRVGAAGRLFSSLDARVRQGRMAVTTIRLNWAELSPGLRWVRRAQAAARP
ncbi:glycosyltransferase family 2 protein [Micrococcus flavus]|uniref:4,4'-diaponeurosporenoate glycosyltransferase n=1 Tax=Micrococcus flavus TaxID=384602 RepID=A0A7W7L170_9MICC|nr:glycosyltransferase family 2 protein [Micrococcus flavus]MBB4881753.1 glycosyltransferase involved in cell wall biosynthesis [Micrococcus flavus]GGK53417.1 glycosyl hydrolase [Micrococcus flavus]